MSESEPKGKRQKMDEYNERRRIARKRNNSFPGTRGFGACSSTVLLGGKLPELLNGSGKRKRDPSSNKQHPKSSSVIVNSNKDTVKHDSDVALQDNREDATFSFDNYMESAVGTSLLNNIIENIGIIEKDVAETRKLKKTWKERVEATECAWKEVLKTLHDDVFATQAFYPVPCTKCGSQLTTFAVRCSSCTIICCGECDLLCHKSQPFHIRKLNTSTSSIYLLAQQFVDENGELFSIGIPVPCFPPEKCSSCECQGHFETEAADQNIAVVAKDGRFDLKSTKFSCKNCGCKTKPTAVDYIASGFWPGDPQNISYLISTDLLRFWYLTKHNMPGTSMNKFIETLETLFDEQRPCKPINKIHFQNASRYYEYFMHQIDVNVKLMDKTVCLSCKGIMLASHSDGNFKLYRLLSALGINSSSLYGGVVIALDEEMEKHMALIDSKLPKSKSSETCGDSIFKAARTDAAKFKKLDETGIMMRSCRHGIVDKAVNMHHGETFRHTHFMHLDLPEKRCTFLCGDVICRYWDWAQKVGSLFPEYKPMVDEMKPFLGRMHAKVHVWYCQILWVGHWMPKAAMTLGEEQEQVFSKMSRYGSVTKHMGKANRRDHLTAAILFWNEQKEKGMIYQLLKRRKRALKQIKISKKQLDSDKEKYKFKLQDFPILLGELRKAAEECKAGKENTGNASHLNQAQKSLEGYNAHIKILKSRISRIATTSGQRIKLRKAISLMLKKRFKLITFINANSDIKVEEEHLLSGHFPWQNLSGSRCNSNMTFHEKFQVIDNWMILLRSKEEVLQSEKEMQNYMKSLSYQITSLEKQMDNIVSIPHSSTAKEMKIAQQKNVIMLAEKNRLHESLALAVSKFNEANGNFLKETDATSVPITAVSESFTEENEEEDFTDECTDEEEVDDYDEEELYDWSEEDSSSDEDMLY